MSQLKPQEVVRLGDIQMANHLPFVLFGGMNVLESKDLAFEIAETYVDICKRLDIPYVFKASFDKANRSSLNSFVDLVWKKGLNGLLTLKNILMCQLLRTFMNLTKQRLLLKLRTLSNSQLS
jgi:2-dehydro-3-deoxyphosphooctonate aldolase (KDO 8-P synthase)